MTAEPPDKLLRPKFYPVGIVVSAAIAAVFYYASGKAGGPGQNPPRHTEEFSLDAKCAVCGATAGAWVYETDQSGVVLRKIGYLCGKHVKGTPKESAEVIDDARYKQRKIIAKLEEPGRKADALFLLGFITMLVFLGLIGRAAIFVVIIGIGYLFGRGPAVSRWLASEPWNKPLGRGKARIH